MVPQYTTRSQSRSPLPRQQKLLQRLQRTFCFVHSHTCKFEGKNYGIFGGSFHTEIPPMHKILDLDTYSGTSCAMIPIPDCQRALIPRQYASPPPPKKGNRKIRNLYFYQTSLGNLYIASQVLIHGVAFQKEKVRKLH